MKHISTEFYFIVVGKYKNKKIKNNDIMKEKIKRQELPLLPTRGWKKQVAKAAGVSEKTVYNTLSGRIRGPKSHRVIDAYRLICQQTRINQPIKKK